MDRNKMNEAIDDCRNKLEQIYRLGYESGRLDEIESHKEDNKKDDDIFDKFCSCMTCKHILIKLSKRAWGWSSDTLCIDKFTSHINPLWCCVNYEKDENWQNRIKDYIIKANLCL